jgi:hypothetical protein
MRAGENYTVEEGIIETNCDAAIAAGCDDPIISYLYVRFSLAHQDISKGALAESFSRAAQKINLSSYPDVRKFWVSVWAAKEAKAAAGSNTPMGVVEFRGMAMANLTAALSDRSMPPEEVYGDCDCLFDTLQVNSFELTNWYKFIEIPLFANYDKSLALLVRGEAYIDMAWSSRGNGYADTVTDAGWTNFEERLGVAEKALDEAWSLNSNQTLIPTAMLTLELGQGNGRERMEMWFNRAMALDPDNDAACEAKRYYLEPKWYGSSQDMLAFGRQCVESKAWGGRVPLTLVNAHKALAEYQDESERPLYWKQPQVWQDLKAAFTKYLQTNPNDFIERQEFALYAYRCEQWNELNEQLPSLGKIHFDIFGGKAEFYKMVRLAKEHAGESNVASAAQSAS